MRVALFRTPATEQDAGLKLSISFFLSPLVSLNMALDINKPFVPPLQPEINSREVLWQVSITAYAEHSISPHGNKALLTFDLPIMSA